MNVTKVYHEAIAAKRKAGQLENSQAVTAWVRRGVTVSGIIVRVSGGKRNKVMVSWSDDENTHDDYYWNDWQGAYCNSKAKYQVLRPFIAVD